MQPMPNMQPMPMYQVPAPSQKNTRQVAYSKKITHELLADLKKSGHVDKTTMFEVVVRICNQVTFAHEGGGHVSLLINKTRFAILPLTDKTLPFSKFVTLVCTEEAGKQALGIYNTINSGYMSVASRKSLEGAFTAEILRTGSLFESGICQITERLGKYEKEGVLEEFGVQKEQLATFLRNNLEKLPTSMEPWRCMVNPFWGLCELFVDGHAAPEDSLRGRKLFWGVKQYPRWQMAVLNKFMSVPYLSPYLNEDVGRLIIRRVFILSALQPIEEVTAESSTKVKRLGGVLSGDSAKRQRTL